jgi:hypothetical protein
LKSRSGKDGEGFPLDWILMGLMMAALIWITS